VNRIEPVTITVGATVLSDTLSLVVFAMCVSTFERGFSVGGLARQLIEIVVFVPLLLFCVGRGGKFILKRAEGDEQAYFVLMLGIMAAAVAVTRVVELPGIVGAFLAGLAVNSAVQEKPAKEKLEFFGNSLFIPLFFIVTGFLIYPVVFVRSIIDNFALAAAVVGALIIGKGIAAAIAARVFDYTRAAQMTMWSLTLPQVAATLAATLVGFDTLNSAGQRLIAEHILAWCSLRYPGHHNDRDDQRRSTTRRCRAPAGSTGTTGTDHADSGGQPMNTRTSPKHVVIVGGGFAGLACARKLAKSDAVRVTVIDKNNYHQFQPLLYQVATAELGTGDVATSLRQVLHGHPNVDVKMAEVMVVDPKTRTVTTKGGDTHQGDYLVLAAGSQANFFDTEGAEKYSMPLYSLEEAERLRSRVLAMFEEADSDPKLVDDGALNFVIVGGGPTGTELAGRWPT
jgi:hypothetical protein